MQTQTVREPKLDQAREEAMTRPRQPHDNVHAGLRGALSELEDTAANRLRSGRR
jgi:hypothetical protein